MPSQNLVTVVAVGPLAPGASAVVTHGLKSGGVGVAPTQVSCDRASPISVFVADATTVTFKNNGPIAASATFRIEFDHSIHAVGAPILGWQGYVPPYAAPSVAIFGQFSDSTVSRNIDAAVPHYVTYDRVEASNGIALAAGPGGLSRIVAPQAGVYEFGISPQFTVTGGGSSTVSVWARLDGTDIPRSNSRVLMGNNNSEVFPFISLIIRMTAGQYFEWMVHGTGANTFLTSFPANGLHPANPAIIAGAKLIGS